ncbi:MAG: tetratricopeptide repeat protein [bacterium]
MASVLLSATRWALPTVPATALRGGEHQTSARAARCSRGIAHHLASSVTLASLASLAFTLNTPAVAAYENVRVEDVESTSLRAGLEAANERRWVAAERFFQMYLRETPEELSASGYSNLGNVHLQMGKVDEAVQDYAKAVRLSDGAAVPLLNQGLAYEELGVRAEKAGKRKEAARLWQTGRESLLKAIEKDPDEFAAYYDLGLIEWRLGLFEEASEHLAKAADLAAIPGYRVRSAAALFQVGDVKKALVQLRGVVRKTPNYGEAHAALAAVYYSMGSIEMAEDELSRADGIDPLWGVPADVERNTRWPPALSAAYQRMISMS